MFRSFAAALALLCAMLTTTDAVVAPLAVLSKKMSQTNLKVGQGHFNMLVLEITFNQPVYYKNTFLSDDPLAVSQFRNTTQQEEPECSSSECSGGGGGGGGAFPDITRIGGAAMFTCGDYQVQGYGNMDGPPNFMITVPPTEEPAKSFLAYMAGTPDVFGHETWFASKWTGAIMMSGNDQGEQFEVFADMAAVLACSPTVTFPGTIDPDFNPSPGTKICNSAGTAFAGDVAFVQQDVAAANVCVGNGVNKLEADFERLLELAKSATTQDASKGLEFLIGSFSSGAAWNACRQQLSDFVATATATVAIPPPPTQAVSRFGRRNNCRSRYGTADYAIDPCCNRTVAQTKCCAPSLDQSTFVRYERIVQFNDDVLAERCAHPEAIKVILADFVAAKQKAADEQAKQDAIDAAAAASSGGGGGGGNDNLFAIYTAFLSTCQSEIFMKECTVDSDCKYGRKVCDTTNSLMCMTDWTSSDIDMAACVIEEMPVDLKFAMMRKWGIQQATTDAFAAEFRARVFVDNCVGPASQQFQRQYGNRGQLISAGDEQGCLGPAGCNWNEWQNQDHAQCVGGLVNATYGLHVCGLFQGQSYRDFAQIPRCVIPEFHYSNEQACTAAGFTFIGGMGQGPQMCVDSTHSTSASACVTNGGTNTLTYCNNPDHQWPCGQDVCFVPYNCTVYRRNFPAMSTVNGVFDRQETGVCMYNPPCPSCGGNGGDGGGGGRPGPSAPLTRQGCSSINMTMRIGRRWKAGSWSTRQECDAGVCNVNRLQNTGVTEEECDTAVKCSQQCSVCRASRNGQIDAKVCFSNSNTTTQQECGTAGGSFYIIGSDSASARCVVPDITTSDACTGTGMPSATFFACTQRTSSSSCSLASSQTWAARYLGCAWDERADCVTEEQCTTQGRCEDEQDFNYCTPPTNGSPIPVCRTEFCVTPFQYDANGNILASSCPGAFGGGGPQALYRQTRVGCLNINVTTSLACTLIHGTWHGKASTEEQCSAHGSACIRDYRNNWDWTQQPEEECVKCGGQVLPVYRWRTGTVLSSHMEPLTWQERAWTRKNQWRPAIDQRKLNDEINKVVADISAQQVVNRAAAQYSSMLPLMKVLACDCGDGDGSGCLTDFSPFVVAGECVQDPGSTTMCNGILLSNDTEGGAGVSFQAVQALAGMVAIRASVFSNQDGQSVGDGGIHLMSVPSSPSPSSRRLLAAPEGSNSDLYSVIKNDNDAIVGQLIGNGQTVPLGNASSALVCLPQLNQIDLNSNDFSEFDFVQGQSVLGFVVLGQPMNLAVDRVVDSICGTVTETGTYFPIYRKADWETIEPDSTATGQEEQSGGTPASSSSSTASAATGTVSSSSSSTGITSQGAETESSPSLTVTVWIMIVIGSVFGAAVLKLASKLFYNLFCSPESRGYSPT